jgi:aspartate 4-decarboxylase
MKDSVPRARQHELEELSPFELKDQLIALADENHVKSATAMLNAGRGNPNWIAAAPREAFFLLGKFGMSESRRAWDEWDEVGGMPVKKGIAERFVAFLNANRHEPGADLLRRSTDYATSELSCNPDAFVYELTDGVVGDNYPVRMRILPHMEQVVHAYLVKELCGGRNPARPYDLFATEGGTAAMCYVFNSLQVNGIVNRGDRVAIMVPAFTPYLEMPRLDRYDLKVTEIKASMVNADGFHTWQYDDSELEKLANPDIKAVYLVNPSNPPSVMMAPASMDKLAEIVRKKNPGLAIITDDVYATFVNGYRSMASVLPRNTISVYSFSKYFGCTGWRLGVVAISQDNIFDSKIAALKSNDKKDLARRYSPITLEPDKLKFIDRMVADSREVALNHTAGLSLPQQIQMGLMALMALTDTDDRYKTTCQAIIARRAHALTKGMLVPLPRDPYAANYYVELDLLSWMERQWGKDFATYMRKNFEPADVLFRLAENHSVVLLPGGGFDGPQWSVRVSLANLPMADYEKIGDWLGEAMQEYKAEFDEARDAQLAGARK